MNAAFESKLHHIIGIVINLEVKIEKCPAERIYYVDLLQYIVRLSLLLFTTAALISQLHGWIHPTMDILLVNLVVKIKKEAWAREADGA